jgi:hypothetical protein
MKSYVTTFLFASAAMMLSTGALAGRDSAQQYLIDKAIAAKRQEQQQAAQAAQAGPEGRPAPAKAKEGTASGPCLPHPKNAYPCYAR